MASRRLRKLTAAAATVLVVAVVAQSIASAHTHVDEVDHDACVFCVSGAEFSAFTDASAPRAPLAGRIGTARRLAPPSQQTFTRHYSARAPPATS